jgi:2-polyprenyl-6-hydroxyphenyl methylase/3-demethylubiquinone-9 3-methyltransferase
MFADTGVMVRYWACPICDHIWTPCLDDWTSEDFQRRIYNDDYVLADPPFTYDRPARNAGLIDGIVGSVRETLAILDWGGGSGLLARLLRDRGFREALSCDPFYGDGRPAPERRFELVTCFEVVEHVPDQRALFGELAGLVAPRGALLLSTLIQPDDIRDQGLGWWYARPRNGHIRLHSRFSLEHCLAIEGLELVSLTEELHVAFRTIESPVVRALLEAEVQGPSLPALPALSSD